MKSNKKSIRKAPLNEEVKPPYNEEVKPPYNEEVKAPLNEEVTAPLNEANIRTNTNTINHEEIAWKIIDKFFAQDPNILVKHHLESYNDFFNNKIHNIFKEKNPILIMKEQDEETKEYNFKAEL